MRRGVDTNVLVCAHMPALPQHAPAHAYLRGQLEDRAVTLVVTPMVLHELVHVVTDPRRFDPPVSMNEAVATARLYLGRSNVECLAVDETATSRALDLISKHRLGRKRIAGTLLAATLLANGVRELITCNPGDFRIFEGLETIDPLTSKSASRRRSPRAR